MAASAAPSILAELATQLRARPNLSGVTVTTHPVGPEDSPLSSIQLHTFTTDQEWTRGDTRLEIIRIEGTLIVKGTGKTDAAWAAIRTAAAAILDEVEQELRDDPSINATAQTGSGQYLGAEWEPAIVGDSDPAYNVTFTIQAQAELGSA